MRTSPHSSFSKSFMVFLLALSLMGPLPWAAAAQKKININSASVGQLVAVQGIGQDTAENIVAYIKEHGLQDAKAKRTIKTDAKLKAVFGGKSLSREVYFADHKSVSQNGP